MKSGAAPGVPELILEQFRLGEAPADEAARIAALLRTDPDIQGRVAALERSDETIANQYGPGRLAARALERTSQASTRHPAPAWRRLVLAASCAAALLVLVLAWPAHDRPEADTERLKGTTPALSVYRRTPQGSETLADGAVGRPGDLLRLGYVSAGRTHGVILSIDGRGIVTLHLPPEGTRAARLGAGGLSLLDDAFELDDAPAWERFYFVTADHAFEIGPVIDAARRAAAARGPSPPGVLPLARELGQSTFLLQKEVRP